MIKNERQYRITRAQAVRFSEALRNLEVEGRKSIQPPCTHYSPCRRTRFRANFPILKLR